MTGAADGTRRRPSLAGVFAAVAGILVSVYLTIEHYSHSASFACPESATINCVKVTTSRWSVIAGVPVAGLGLAYFVVMLTLLVTPARYRVLATLRLAGAVAGVVMVLYLIYIEIYIELFQVDAICLWCTAVHVLTVILFVAVLWQSIDAPTDRVRST